MLDREILKIFNSYFPQHGGENIDTWFLNGKNSIRIRNKNGKEFIFTFNNDNDWGFTSINNYYDYKIRKKKGIR